MDPCSKGEACDILSQHVGANVSNVLFIIAGIIVILAATGLSIRTFMVPGEAPPFYNRSIFRVTQVIFNFASRFTRSEARKHQVLSLYAPTSLLLVLATILALIGFGYTLAFYGVGIKPFIRAFLYSGSAISTLGFESPGNNFWVIMLSAGEALTVATIVALLVGYLPNIYSAYQDRESAVMKLHNLAGPAPDGVTVVDTYVKTYGYENLGTLWQTWQEWFMDLAHSGTTLAGELYMDLRVMPLLPEVVVLDISGMNPAVSVRGPAAVNVMLGLELTMAPFSSQPMNSQPLPGVALRLMVVP